MVIKKKEHIMVKKSHLLKSTIIYILISTTYCFADNIFKLRMYFGLSLPNGSAVSLYDWQQFESQELAKTFTGFNIVDSVGYYKGKPEKSKIVTIILKENDINKAKMIAKRYAKKFKQDSVMIVKTKVTEWNFISY